MGGVTVRACAVIRVRVGVKVRFRLRVGIGIDMLRLRLGRCLVIVIMPVTEAAGSRIHSKHPPHTRLHPPH